MSSVYDVSPPALLAEQGRLPSIEEIVQRGLVRTVFQPIVSLETGDLVAAEALSRGPAGSPLESPMEMLRAAEIAGILAELDDLFRSTALQSALRLGWPSTVSLFVNAEPRVLTAMFPASLAIAQAKGLDITVELTERDLTHDVGMLLEAGETARSRGMRVALDDVGADPASLALIALLRPDVVKLDMALIRSYGAGEVAEVANAVRAYSEESGATVVAEGIETAADVRVAEVLGAHLGQGWWFGRPHGDLPHSRLAARRLGRSRPMPPALSGASPYQIACQDRRPAVSTKELLLPLSLTLEQRSTAMTLPPLLLSTFQHARHFTEATRARYTGLAARLPFVCALGAEMPLRPAPGVRGASLDGDDQVTGEWTVVVLGAHFAAALIAQDLGDTGPDRLRRFSYLVTHDRALVVAAARSLVARVVT